MTHWNFTRSIAGIRLLVELGALHGLQARQCLLGTGIREKDLGDPSGVVSAEQELRLIRNLLGKLQQVPALGVQVGMRYHYTTFGSLGFAMATSQSTRKALDVALRYFSLTYAFSDFEASDTEHESSVLIDASAVPADVQRFIMERDSVALVTVQRELAPTADALLRVDFPFSAPKDVSSYVQALGITPQFGQRQMLVVFDRQKLSLHLPQENELVRKFCEEQCVKLLERYRARIGVAAKVREKLACNAELGMEELATALCMTSRTLRRQLTEEGASFTAIRDEVRMALAEEYLVVLNLSVEETAYRLGYSSSSAFIMAFGRMSGETPLAFKKRLLESARIGSVVSSSVQAH
jgi:AraC-like DNA-binding protein